MMGYGTRLLLVIGACGLFAAGMMFLGGCGSEPVDLTEPARDEQQVALQVAGMPVTAELALDAPARARGLMHRTSLDEDRGMLFVFPKAKPQKFWMRDTLIGLDIIFLADDGTVLNIHQAPPGVEQPGFPSKGPCRLVLELSRGWSARHGLKPGDRVPVPAELFARAVP